MLKNYDEMHNEVNMLNGNINRMCITSDKYELYRMYEFAIKRVEAVYEYNLNRLEQKENEV